MYTWHLYRTIILFTHKKIVLNIAVIKAARCCCQILSTNTAKAKGNKSSSSPYKSYCCDLKKREHESSRNSGKHSIYK